MPTAQTQIASQTSAAGQARLTARPQADSNFASPGLHRLEVCPGQPPALLYVPPLLPLALGYPLVMFLHASAGTPEESVEWFRKDADADGFAVLAPAASERRWNLTLLDRALQTTFGMCAALPSRIAIGGFADGASCALSLGLANADLFRHILAFSPGCCAPVAWRGQARVFLAHGLRDAVLPVRRCTRRIAKLLEEGGYAVSLREFDGEHRMTPEIRRAAIKWWLVGD